jgi:DNA-binding Lrp family transcriptional regulator
MEYVERLILSTVQASFPVVSRPYCILGRMAGISEAESLARIEHLRHDGMIRRLGGVFDSRRLGYYSTLCATRVPEDKIPVLAQILAQIPGVTHSYLRNHAYNMWFTLIASSKAKAEAFLTRLRQQSGIQDIYSLPAMRIFKINVNFDLMRPEEHKSVALNAAGIAKCRTEILDTAAARKLTLEEIELIKFLQDDLPAGLTPYAKLANFLSWTEEHVLEQINLLRREGIIRRFGAVLRHQKAGFTANAMGVWQVPEEQVAEVGLIMSRFKEVSHCYQRPKMPDWPYNIFSMVHGQSPEECRTIMENISNVTKVEKYDMLFSTAELKKSSMKYFLD